MDTPLLRVVARYKAACMQTQQPLSLQPDYGFAPKMDGTPDGEADVLADDEEDHLEADAFG